MPVLFTLNGVMLMGYRPDLGGVFMAEAILLILLYSAREFVVAVKSVLNDVDCSRSLQAPTGDFF